MVEMSHKFRDHLARVSLPFDFYTPDSPEGRALLERAETPGPLPIAILHDGRIFVRPDDGKVETPYPHCYGVCRRERCSPTKTWWYTTR